MTLDPDPLTVEPDDEPETPVVRLGRWDIWLFPAIIGVGLLVVVAIVWLR